MGTTYRITFDEENNHTFNVTKIDGGDDLIIHFTEWESASTYSIHPWDGLSGDVVMNYEGYFNGAHWWKTTIARVASQASYK